MEKVTELLKGCRPIKDTNGKIVVQSILNMELVCLTCDDEFSIDRFENPFNANASNSTYGEITLKNNSSNPMIVPTQIAAITKQRAQNHGMVKAGYVPSNTSHRFNDAGCVEGSQGGTYSDVTGKELRLIPVSMREMLYAKVGETSGHGNIYPAIEELGRETKSNAGTYLNKYFEKYDEKLETFIAHFERPEKLIGTIVLIDGEIVAIDKFPSFRYAEQVWDVLIRDCYGALAIISESRNEVSLKSFTNTLSATRRKANESVIDQLARALNKMEDNNSFSINERLEDLLTLEFESELDPDSDRTYKSKMLKDEGYLGQVISEGGFHHLVSIIKKKAFNPEAYRIHNELARKARKQNEFTL